VEAQDSVEEQEPAETDSEPPEKETPPDPS